MSVLERKLASIGVVLRPARLTDARAIAEVHVAGWRWAYRGIVPDEHIDALSVDQSEGKWQEMLARADDDRQVIVAEQGDRLVDFARAGQPRDLDSPDGSAELQSIYLAQDIERHGWRSDGAVKLSRYATAELRTIRFARLLDPAYD